MYQTILLTVFLTIFVAPSFSFVPQQSRRGCLVPSAGRLNRNAVLSNFMAAADDDSAAATTEIPADDDGNVAGNEEKQKRLQYFS